MYDMIEWYTYFYTYHTLYHQSLNSSTRYSMKKVPNPHKLFKNSSTGYAETQHGEQQKANQTSHLKMPKCDNFDLLFFTLINHICVGDLGTGKKLFNLKT
jgi:hypothetical protein